MAPYKVNFIPDIVIYHKNCMDGFGAAYAVWSKYKHIGIEYCAASYSKDKDKDSDAYKVFWKDKVRGKKVVIVDFCFPLGLQVELHNEAEELIVLDHHKSAQEAMKGHEFCHFRQDMSGALITWNAFHEEPAPALIDYVSDRDLWKWELPYSQEVNTVVQSTQKNFLMWHDLEKQISNAFDSVVEKGKNMCIFKDQSAAELSDSSEVWTIGDLEIRACNTTILQSEACHDILHRNKYVEVAGSYFIKEGNMVWSLRSKGNIDVSAMAGKLNGGGHVRAAGFRVSVDSNKVDMINRIIRYE